MAALAVVGAIIMGCAGEDMANEAPQAKNGNKVIQTPEGQVNLAWSSTSQLGQLSGQKDRGAQDTFGWDSQISIVC